MNSIISLIWCLLKGQITLVHGVYDDLTSSITCYTRLFLTVCGLTTFPFMSNGITTDVILSSNSAHSLWFLILTNCMDDISTASAVVLQDPIIKSQKAASYPTCHVSSNQRTKYLSDAVGTWDYFQTSVVS